jgi:hypothetical protein
MICSKCHHHLERSSALSGDDLLSLCAHPLEEESEGVRVPGSAAATYEKSDGDWAYWRGATTLMKDTSTRI